MENSLQGTLNTDSNNFGLTRNPQTIGGQALSKTSTELQNTDMTGLSQTGLKITSVGSSELDTVAVSSNTTSTPNDLSSQTLAPLYVGLFFALAAIIAVAFIAIKKGTKTSDK